MTINSNSTNKIQGVVAHDAAAGGNPVRTAGVYHSTPPTLTDGDLADLLLDADGKQGVYIGDRDGTNTPQIAATTADGQSATNAIGIATRSFPFGFAPDGAWDRIHTAGDAAPSLGALSVALIGGDQTLRASAAISEASGQSTALDNMGWVRAFLARLDVTAAPSGGSPTLDVFIQTQLPSGDWQDVAAFTRATGVTAENLSWGPWTGELSQILAEAASAFAVDQFFADQDVAMGAATVRTMVLGDSLRVKWVFAAGGSTGDFTFALDFTPKS